MHGVGRRSRVYCSRAASQARAAFQSRLTVIDRHLQHFGDVLFAQAAEEAQLDDARGARIGGGQRRQQRVEVEQLFARDRGAPPVHVRERHAPLLAAALAGDAGARMIDEDAAHRLRGDGEEVGAILDTRSGWLPMRRR